MSTYEQQVIKSGDYSDEVLREWLKVNGITEFISEDETVYVVNGYITARCFTTDVEKEIPFEFPMAEINVYDIHDYWIGRWELKEDIQDTERRLAREGSKERHPSQQ